MIVKWHDDDSGQYTVTTEILMFLDLSTNTFAASKELYVVIISCVAHPVKKDKPRNEGAIGESRNMVHLLCVNFWNLRQGIAYFLSVS